MKVSSNAKHGTDKKADKFWDTSIFKQQACGNLQQNQRIECTVHFNWDLQCWVLTKLLAEKTSTCCPNFFGIVRWNKPLFGEVVGDMLMDLHFQLMHKIYASVSHTYKKMCQETSPSAWTHFTSFPFTQSFRLRFILKDLKHIPLIHIPW